MNKQSIPSSVSPFASGELVSRLLFLLLGLFVFRVGAHIPVPGLDPATLQEVFDPGKSSVVGWLSMFSGGALQQRLAIFALGIMPYISASIMVQLLSAVSPQLKELRKSGESGQRKISQYTRYTTVALAIFQGFGMAKFLVVKNIALSTGLLDFYFPTVLTLVAGTLFLMWLGEQITEKGIGNGISLIIFSGIVAGLPGAVGNTLKMVREGNISLMMLLLIIVLIITVIAFIVFVERGQRRITVNYAKQQRGRTLYAAQTSHLPLKINMAGVIPPIFASSIILFPTTLASWFGEAKHLSWLSDFSASISRGQPLYVLFFSMAIIFFCFFYTAIVFNPNDTADNLKRSGAYIPGIRPGRHTANYIDGVMTRLTFAGAIYVTLVCLLPEFMSFKWNVPFYFGGTSLLIIIVVIMDFIAQLQSLLMSQQYGLLMNQSNLQSGKRNKKN